MDKNPSYLEIEHFLHNIWAFEMLEPDQLGLLAKIIKPRNLGRDEILWLQGQRVTYFTVVYNGNLRSVRRSSSGAEKLVSVLPRGHHFGLAEMITGATSAVTIIANKPSLVLTMDHKLLKKRLLSSADICYRLMQTMARAIFSLTRELERASFENVPTRLSRLLLRKSTSPLGSPLPQSITHADLALQIGISRETVSRVLAEFKKKKLIETGYRSITVLNRDGLMNYIEDYDQW
ncbi:MAG: Crp/Fnr family transcriptional regulator [Sedimentisphaerales bacterium]|nr:Crp/Fnr family transcriptional regulator [Sedimentisphaerales bacterium]